MFGFDEFYFLVQYSWGWMLFVIGILIFFVFGVWLLIVFMCFCCVFFVLDVNVGYLFFIIDVFFQLWMEYLGRIQQIEIDYWECWLFV